MFGIEGKKCQKCGIEGKKSQKTTEMIRFNYHAEKFDAFFDFYYII